MIDEQRVWCAMIYASDIHDVAGAVRRSERLHRKQADARRELEGWVTEMNRDQLGGKSPTTKPLWAASLVISRCCRVFCSRKRAKLGGHEAGGSPRGISGPRPQTPPSAIQRLTASEY